MPSTASEKSPNFARRIKWLGIWTAAIFALYSAGWYFIAQEGKRRVDEALLKSAEAGAVAECDQSQIKGYPFRLGLFCDAVKFEQSDKGISITAGALRSAAQVYNPKHAVVELDGPAEVSVPGLVALTLNWDLMHASLRVASPVPERASLEAKKLEISGNAANFATAEYAAGHMRREDNSVSFAGEGGVVVIAPQATPGRVIPEFSASYDLVLKDGVRVLSEKPKSFRGLSGIIRGSQIIFKEGGTLKLEGPVSVNAEGLVDADLSIGILESAKLSISLSKAAPEVANVIATALTTASLGGDETKLDVKIRNGKVAIGFFPIGQIPPLR